MTKDFDVFIEGFSSKNKGIALEVEDGFEKCLIPNERPKPDNEADRADIEAVEDTFEAFVIWIETLVNTFENFATMSINTATNSPKAVMETSVNELTSLNVASQFNTIF